MTLSAFRASPTGWLNDEVIDLIIPAKNGVVTKDAAKLSVEGVDYPLQEITGDDRKKTMDFAVDTSRRIAEFRDGSGQNLFFLPWKSDAFFSMTLDPSASIFLTAKVNGCCVWIGGDRASPTIVHGNVYDKLPTPSSFQKAAEELLPEYDRLYDKAEKAMTSKGILDSKSLTRFDPRFYLDGQPPRSLGFVWGFKDSSNRWTFYYQMERSAEIKKLKVPWRWPVLGIQWGHVGDWIESWAPKGRERFAGQLWPVREDMG